MVLECAALANAGLIVTGDRDLLVLDPYRNTRIVTVRQYLDEYA
jgi:predicted nucleic acid-binding protein